MFPELEKLKHFLTCCDTSIFQTFNMRFLAFAVFAVALVAVSAKPSLGWWGGHGAVSPGVVVVGPAGSISVGASSAGAVIPGWAGHGAWGGHGHGAWGGHGLWGGHGAWGHSGLW